MDGMDVVDLMDKLREMDVGHRTLVRVNQIDCANVERTSPVDYKQAKGGAYHRHSLTSNFFDFANTKLEESHHFELDPKTTFYIKWQTTLFLKSGTKISESITEVMITPQASLKEVLEAMEKGAPN